MKSLYQVVLTEHPTLELAAGVQPELNKVPFNTRLESEYCHEGIHMQPALTCSMATSEITRYPQHTDRPGYSFTVLNEVMQLLFNA